MSTTTKSIEFQAEVPSLTPRSSTRVRAQVADWLLDHYWTRFVTLTFRFPVSPEVAERRVRRWLPKTGIRPYAYLALEHGRSDLIHAHALLGDTSPKGAKPGSRSHELTMKLAMADWHQRQGLAEDHGPFRPGGGATWYLLKQADHLGTILGQPRRVRYRDRITPYWTT